jgi:hypothetical protein
MQSRERYWIASETWVALMASSPAIEKCGYPVVRARQQDPKKGRKDTWATKGQVFREKSVAGWAGVL